MATLTPEDLRNQAFTPATEPFDTLLWADVETTGLDPHSNDKLLQIAAFLTDVNLAILSPTLSFVIHYDEATTRHLRENVANDYVRAMHDKTGLWDKLPHGTPLPEVDKALTGFITEHAPADAKIRLTGNSARLDKDFTEVFLPATNSLLTYRITDVSAVAFLAAAWGLTPGYFTKGLAHEAEGDIRESYDELAWIRSHLTEPA